MVARRWLEMAGIGLLGGWPCSREEESEVCDHVAKNK